MAALTTNRAHSFSCRALDALILIRDKLRISLSVSQNIFQYSKQYIGTRRWDRMEEAVVDVHVSIHKVLANSYTRIGMGVVSPECIWGGLGYFSETDSGLSRGGRCWERGSILALQY